MAQEIVRWCDSHITRDDERVPASQYDVVLRRLGDPFAFVSVDLCDACAKPLGDLLGELVELGRPFDETTLSAVQDGAGRPAARRAAARVSAPDSASLTHTAGTHACPACGTVLANKPSLLAHARTQHGKTLAELAGEPVPYECKSCGRRFPTAQGLQVHSSRAHKGVPATPAGT